MARTPKAQAIHTVGPVTGFDQAIAEMVRITRAVGAGKVEVDTGAKMVGMLRGVVTAIHFRRKAELEARKLDLLGAAAESGAAVFEGFAIVPPASRVQPPEAAAPPLLEAKPNGELLELKAPSGKRKK